MAADSDSSSLIYPYYVCISIPLPIPLWETPRQKSCAVFFYRNRESGGISPFPGIESSLRNPFPVGKVFLLVAYTAPPLPIAAAAAVSSRSHDRV